MLAGGVWTACPQGARRRFSVPGFTHRGVCREMQREKNEGDSETSKSRLLCRRQPTEQPKTKNKQEKQNSKEKEKGDQHGLLILLLRAQLDLILRYSLDDRRGLLFVCLAGCHVANRYNTVSYSTVHTTHTYRIVQHRTVQYRAYIHTTYIHIVQPAWQNSPPSGTAHIRR